MAVYELTFTGRKLGALGILDRMTDQVHASDSTDALIKLYERYEHIEVLKCERLPDPECSICRRRHGLEVIHECE